MLTAVIIEDEKKFLSAFKSIISSACPQVKLSGDCGSIKEARQLITELKPDIVFLDIQLSDGNAFDLLRFLETDLEKNAFNSLRIIFTTASNQFAIQAFRFSAIDYLLKPIIADELKEAVKKAEVLKNALDSPNQYRVLLDNVSMPDAEKKICLSTLNEMRVCSVHDILRCESEHNYTTFYFIKDKPLMVSKTLKEYEDLLNEYGFERVHQSHLVNLKHIKSYIKKDGGFILMKDGSEIPISRRKKEQVLEIIKKL
ncbi:MAG: response regulator transcription factor [Bacteroidetes bacterium]|nr:response regulator transcription factor [Bacteroidota bacterium]